MGFKQSFPFHFLNILEFYMKLLIKSYIKTKVSLIEVKHFIKKKLLILTQYVIALSQYILNSADRCVKSMLFMQNALFGYTCHFSIFFT